MIRSKPASKEYLNNYDNVFSKKANDFCIVVHSDGTMTDLDTGRHIKEQRKPETPKRFLLENYLEQRSKKSKSSQ